MILSALLQPPTVFFLHSVPLPSPQNTSCMPPSTYAPLTLVLSSKLKTRVSRNTSPPQAHPHLPPPLCHTLSFHQRLHSPPRRLRAHFQFPKTALLPKLLVIPPLPPPISIYPSQNYPPNSTTLYPLLLPTVGPALSWLKTQTWSHNYPHLREEIMGLAVGIQFHVSLRSQTQMQPLTSVRSTPTLPNCLALIAPQARTWENQLPINQYQTDSVVCHTESQFQRSLKHLILDQNPRPQLDDLLHLCHLGALLSNHYHESQQHHYPQAYGHQQSLSQTRDPQCRWAPDPHEE